MKKMFKLIHIKYIFNFDDNKVHFHTLLPVYLNLIGGANVSILFLQNLTSICLSPHGHCPVKSYGLSSGEYFIFSILQTLFFTYEFPDHDEIEAI